MKVGHQGVDDREVVAGMDEEVGLASRRSNAAAGRRRRVSSARVVVVPTAMMRRAASCADRIARAASATDVEPFWIDLVVLDAVDAHGFERAVPDMQRDRRPPDARRRECVD